MTRSNPLACLAVAGALLLSASIARATIPDDFEDPARDPFWSHIAIGPGPTASETGGVLRLTTPATSTGGLPSGVLNIYRSNCTFGGDFDASASFAIVTQPTNPNRGWGVNLQAFSTAACRSSPFESGSTPAAARPTCRAPP